MGAPATIPAGATAGVPKPRPRRRRRSELKGWLFLAPALILNVGVILVPALLTAGLAFTDWNGISTPKLVGQIGRASCRERVGEWVDAETAKKRHETSVQ